MLLQKEVLALKFERSKELSAGDFIEALHPRES